jgi:hypothetical protein
MIKIKMILLEIKSKFNLFVLQWSCANEDTLKLFRSTVSALTDISMYKDETFIFFLFQRSNHKLVECTQNKDLLNTLSIVQVSNTKF